MFTGQILSGDWDKGWIEITGMPKDFVLSARKLVVMEQEEYHELVSEMFKWKNAYEAEIAKLEARLKAKENLEKEKKP